VKPILIKIEKHSDKFIAYPVGVSGLGMLIKGDAYEEVLSDVKSAVASFIETCCLGFCEGPYCSRGIHELALSLQF